MIDWSNLLFVGIQLAIMFVHYHLSVGQLRRLSSVEDQVDSMRGKMNNARGDARREARKAAEEALEDPALRNQEQSDSGGMDEMSKMMMLMQMMGGGQPQPNQEQEEAGGRSTLGSGGSITPESRQ